MWVAAGKGEILRRCSLFRSRPNMTHGVRLETRTPSGPKGSCKGRTYEFTEAVAGQPERSLLHRIRHLWARSGQWAGQERTRGRPRTTGVASWSQLPAWDFR